MWLRNRRAGREQARVDAGSPGGDRDERTRGSGRYHQPTGGQGWITRTVAAPQRAVARLVSLPVGTGLVVVGRRP